MPSAQERGRSVIKTRWNWDDIKQHFAYTWWAYVLTAVLMLFCWQMAYHATEYDPPADKKLQITIAGEYVSTTVLEYYQQRAAEEFPELERITVDNIPLDFTGEGDYSGYTKLQVVVACGEGDIYLLNRELLGIYGEMGAFEPLDELVTKGELAGMFTGEELARGTLSSEEIDDGAAHVYGLPADRLYGLISQGVDTSGLYLTVTSYSGNPEYARKALVWLCEQTKEEPPAWMNDLEELEGEMGQNVDELPEIG